VLGGVGGVGGGVGGGGCRGSGACLGSGSGFRVLAMALALAPSALAGHPLASALALALAVGYGAGHPLAILAFLWPSHPLALALWGGAAVGVCLACEAGFSTSFPQSRLYGIKKSPLILGGWGLWV
jgi:hypothetical protein